jgi:hypothetical protein
MLAGCSGRDDLRVRNNYPFTIRLRSPYGDEIGTVLSGDTKKFDGKAGYQGDSLDQIKYENEQGKVLGKLNRLSPAAKREDVSRFNGAAIWSVTVGPIERVIPRRSG